MKCVAESDRVSFDEHHVQLHEAFIFDVKIYLYSAWNVLKTFVSGDIQHMVFQVSDNNVR